MKTCSGPRSKPQYHWYTWRAACYSCKTHVMLWVPRRSPCLETRHPRGQLLGPEGDVGVSHRSLLLLTNMQMWWIYNVLGPGEWETRNKSTQCSPEHISHSGAKNENLLALRKTSANFFRKYRTSGPGTGRDGCVKLISRVMCWLVDRDSVPGTSRNIVC
jgi:hypothetical protein